MRPFNTREVTCYLLWIVILGAAVGCVLWILFFAAGHKEIQMQPRPTTASMALQKP